LHITFDPPFTEPGNYVVTAASNAGVSSCTATVTPDDDNVVYCTGDFGGELLVVGGKITSVGFDGKPDYVSVEVRRDGSLLLTTGELAVPEYQGDGDPNCGNDNTCFYASLTATH